MNPVFVVEVDEVLDRVDVSQRDRAVGPESLPVRECIAVITEDRGRPSREATSQSGIARLRGKESCRLLADLVDVGRRQEP